MDFARKRRYTAQARVMLQDSFQLLSVSAIDSVLSFSKNEFTDAFRLLSNIESHRLTMNRFSHGAGYFEEIPSDIQVFLKNKRPKKVIDLTEVDELLSHEIDAIPELNTKEDIPIIDLTADSDEENYGGAAEKVKETESECLCCYGDYPLSDLRECKAGSEHFVCKQCINCYVSEQLDGNDRVAFKCIVDANCSHNYTNDILDEVGILSPRGYLIYLLFSLNRSTYNSGNVPNVHT